MDKTNQDHLPSFGVRPRFYLELEASPQEIASKIKASLKEQSSEFVGWSNETYAVLGIPKEQQHFWSPQLAISIAEEEKGAALRGRYEPKPVVWTMFIFFYSTVAFLLFVITIVGTSRWSLGASSAILWWIPVLLLIGLSLFLVSYFGQKLARDQMLQLHQFLEKVLETEIV